MGYGETAHLGAVLGTAAHHVHRNHAVLDDGGIPVDILQETVQSLETLGEAGLELAPFLAGHHPGKAVDGNDALVGLFVAVDREGYALVRKGAGHAILDVGQVFGGEPEEFFVDSLAVLAGCSVRQEHLVIDGRIEIVIVEKHVCNSCGRRVGGIIRDPGGWVKPGRRRALRS